MSEIKNQTLVKRLALHNANHQAIFPIPPNIFMSILSTTTQGSNSSSSTPALSQNPSSDHGSLLLPPSPNPQSPTTPPSQSLQFHDSSPIASRVPGSMAQAAEDSIRSSKKVTDLGTPNGGKKTLSHQQYQFSGGHKIGPSQANVKMLGSSVSPRGQQTDRSISSQGSSAHSVGRRGQVTNGNHLLNFQYDPIIRSLPRAKAPPPRRVQKRKPYNRDLFLQANYKFVVLDSGNYAPESLDPDKMLQWDDIICVRYSTPLPVQCPICLEYPLCPQITACGHIFCFPCILQYLLMGEEDHKGDCWKRCPLCFVMISPKDLYTLYLENVKQYHVSDTMEFMLLTRQKDSYIPSMKNKREDGTQCCNGSMNDSFSKFTFTSDVDLSVRKAISDLDGWLVRADSGLVDDLEKLPYVCAAMEHLEQRKKYWNEHRASDSNRSLEYTDCLGGSHVSSPVANATTTCNNHGQGTMSSNNNIDDQSGRLDGLALTEADRRVSLDQASNAGGSFELQDAYSPGGETKNWDEYTNGFKDTKDKDSYNFYQAVDGQHMILHPLNMKCLLHHYGSYDNLPHRISGKILQLETVTQSEAMRRRYRYLSHFSLTTSFQLCEIDVNGILPSDALLPFMDEIKKREKQRKLLAKKERREKIKAESVCSQPVPILSSFRHSSQDDFPAFSMDDFGALGTATETSSSPPIVGERKLFSRVTKLGFAAAHDSPALKIEEDSTLPSIGVATDSSSVAGSSRSASTMSFANVISKGKSVDNSNAPKLNENGKKGKKPSRVLLSTAGGRRY